MALITIACPNCATSYKVEEAHRGKRTKCSKCDRSFVVEASSRAPAPSDERPRGADGIPLNWEPGDVILDLYEVIALPGTKHGYAEGGMGRVNLVRHREWQRDLAVKSVLPAKTASARDVENFKTEAEQWVETIGLHPNVVACHYVRELGGVPRVFIEYVDGGTLQEWVTSKRLYEGGHAAALARILDIAIQTAWGLHYIHVLGLIHQDVKPLNVMMTKSEVAKVTDFGLAGAKAIAAGEATETTEGQSLLATGAGMMTPAYCSPEQADIQAMKKAGAPSDRWPKLTRRTDVWSWAVSVLYLFLGRIAWPGGQVAHVALGREPDEPHLPPMPEAVRELLGRCLQRRPEDRPHDMMHVGDQLVNLYSALTHQSYPREKPKPEEALADTLNNRGVSLFDLKKQEAAEKKWQEALGVDPHHPEASYNHGLVRWRTQRSSDQEMLQRMREARSSSTDPPRVDYLTGLVHLERTDVPAAVELLTQASQGGQGRTAIASALALARSLVVPAGTFPHIFEEGHTNSFTSVSWSPDSRFVLTGSGDRTMRLWEVPSGKCLRTFGGHTPQKSVPLGPDGRFALVVQAVEGRPPSVKSVAISQDGRFALSVSSDASLRLWEISSGRCLNSFTRPDSRGQGSAVQSVSWSQDGRFATLRCEDRTIQRWEVESGRYLGIVANIPKGMYPMAISSDGRFALMEAHDLRLFLVGLEQGAPVRVLEGHTGKVTACFSPDGRYVLSASSAPTERRSGNLDGNCTLRLWEVPGGTCLRTFMRVSDSVYSLAFSPDGRFALSGGEAVWLWDTSSGQCLRSFEGPAKWMSPVTWSPDSRFVLAVGAKPIVAGSTPTSNLMLWGVTVARPPSPLVLSSVAEAGPTQYSQLLRQANDSLAGDPVRAAELLNQARQQPGCSRREDGLTLARRLSRRLRHRGFAAGWEKRTLGGHSDAVNVVAFSPDGRLLASGGKDKSLRVWEAEGGKCVHTLEGHTDAVLALAWGPDGRRVLSGSWDRTLRHWDVVAGKWLYSSQGESFPVTGVVFSPDGRLALSVGREHKPRLWKAAAHGKCLKKFEGHANHVNAVAFSPDGRFALTGSWDKTLRLWDVPSGYCDRTFRGHTDKVTSVAFSPDGRFALSGSMDHTVRLWDVFGFHPLRAAGRLLLAAATLGLRRGDGGSCVRTFRGHTDWVNSVAISPDGRFALSAGKDGTVRLWDVEGGRCLRVFEGHTGAVTSVAWRPDGRFAASASEDRTLRLWELDWEFEDDRPADWDDRARPLLEAFLTVQGVVGLSDDEIRRGPPKWTDADFGRLLDTLGGAGLGWLRPEGVRRELEQMAASQSPPPLGS